MNPEPNTPAATEKVRPPAAWRVWENPIFRRYCRSRLRARPLSAWMLIMVLLAAFIYLIVPLMSERGSELSQRNVERLELRIKAMQERVSERGMDRRERERLEQSIGWMRQLLESEKQGQPGREDRDESPEMHCRKAIIPLLILQMLILFLFGTGQVAGGMTSERDEGMVDYQRLTPMTPLTKMLGYLFGLPVREWVQFFGTLPFMALALWKGAVPFATWGPVALVFFTSVILYHCTGLVAGTVFKNRRWAFLMSMGLIFLLYTVVPQGARLGLPFLKYVTMWPAAMEAAHIFPDRLMRDWRMFSGHVGGQGIEFFQWNLSDVAFTLVVQGCFIATMLVMVWRKWKRAESHLLSKVGALLLCLWAGVLSMGTVLPGIEDGSVFPESSFVVIGGLRPPSVFGAWGICTAYGILMLVFLLCLVVMVTPNQDSQARGFRRALKLGRRSAPWYADESSAFALVVLLTLAGAAGCAWFTRAALDCHWFTGNLPAGSYLPDSMLKTAGIFLALLAPPVLGFHAMLERQGGKWPFLSVVFIGVVPVLAALVMAVASRREPPVMSVFIGGASPFALPALGIEQQIPWQEFRPPLEKLHGAASSAVRFWPVLYTIAAAVAVLRLRRHWQERRAGSERP